MKILLYLFYLAVIIAPGILLLIASIMFKHKAGAKSGAFFVFGSIFVLCSLLSSTGIYLFSLMGSVEQLANFAMINTWVEGGFKYIGLIMLAIGLLIHRENNDTESA